jgi:hypothetical protein
MDDVNLGMLRYLISSAFLLIAAVLVYLFNSEYKAPTDWRGFVEVMFYAVAVSLSSLIGFILLFS